MIFKDDIDDIDDFINSLTNHIESIKTNTINVAGGLKEANDILKNRPDGCNAYDIMYKEYGYIESWFMIDHNLTINLDDLKEAVDNIDLPKALIEKINSMTDDELYERAENAPDCGMAAVIDEWRKE